MKTPVWTLLGVIALGATVYVGNKIINAPIIVSVDQSDIVWVKGSTPTTEFVGILAPGCLECNDYTYPIGAMEKLKKDGVPYVLVIEGTKATTLAKNFGPSWPNVCSIPREKWEKLGGDNQIGVKFNTKWEMLGFKPLKLIIEEKK